MSKVMLVEDDDSLREIYSIRLTAEGYNIVSARDGEEALAVAVRERPDLIVSDVMMPKITGFDMLDILRSTPETQNIKVIMMTALSSEEERVRGENLGADRYLVKSQVGIEDVVNAVHEVLGDRSQDGTISAAVQPQSAPTAAPSPAAATTAPVVSTAASAAAQPTVVPIAQPPVAAQPVAAANPVATPMAAPTAQLTPAATNPTAAPTAQPAVASPTVPVAQPTIAP